MPDQLPLVADAAPDHVSVGSEALQIVLSIVAGIVPGIVAGVIIERYREGRDRRASQRAARERAYQAYLTAVNGISFAAGLKAREDATSALLDAWASLQLVGSVRVIGMARHMTEVAHSVVNARTETEVQAAMTHLEEARHQTLHFMRTDLRIDTGADLTYPSPPGDEGARNSGPDRR